MGQTTSWSLGSLSVRCFGWMSALPNSFNAVLQGY